MRRASGRGRILRAAVAGILLVPIAVTVVLAHPLGNFTINHHAGIHVEPDRVLLDVVIDQAEVPTFQAVMDLDEDGDGEFSGEELAVAERDGCTEIGEALTLTIDGSGTALRLVEAGLTFPPGNGGLSTMRQVCTFEAPLPGPLEAGTTIAFADGFEASRIGWREMTVVGSGVTVSGDDLLATSPSGRLTAYPAGLAGAPDVRAVSLTATPGGPVLPPFDVPDADQIEPVLIGVGPSASAAPETSAAPPSAPASAAPGASAAPEESSSGAAGLRAGSSGTTGAVPGGEGAIPDILRALPVSPALALLSLVTAALLGAGHALTPGHGKTLMAAYLVGTRGTPRHALGLGAAVSISHTLGILVLAMVVLAAESALPPDLIVQVAPIVAALTIVAIGGWMLVTEIRRGLAVRRAAAVDGHAHVHADPHAHAEGRAPGHAHPHDPEALAAAIETHDHPHPADDGDEHSHGGVPHRHVPPAGATITWRSLFVLGLAGGLIPSTNALLILLATIAAGQPAWGVVLVVGFGVGMAGVMAGVGLAFVYARGMLERGASHAGLGRVARLVPMGAAVLVLSVGVVLTTQALSAVRLG